MFAHAVTVIAFDRDRPAVYLQSACTARPDRIVDTLAGPWAADVKKAAAKEHVPARLVAAVLHVESHGDPRAVSARGAIGLMQIMPGTAYEMRADPWNPRQNIFAGARYLHELLRKFHSVEKALAGYNAGPESVQNGYRDKGYVQRVIGAVFSVV